MQCPKCKRELTAGDVYCPVCGQEVQIVPDYDPLDEVLWEKEEDQDGKSEGEKDKDGEAERKKGSGKKTFAEQLLALLADPISRKICLCIAALVICVSAAVGGYRLTTRKSSFGYQLKQGIANYESGNLEQALSCLRRARELKADDAQAVLYLGKTYSGLGEKGMAAGLLRNLIRYPLEEKDLFEAYVSLFQALSGTAQANEITALIEDCPDAQVAEKLRPYRIEKPTVSVNGGVYTYYVTPRLEAVYGEIYYTLDGSTPTEESTVYKEPIRLKEGENMLTAVAVNDMDIVSEPLFVVYTIDLSGASLPPEEEEPEELNAEPEELNAEPEGLDAEPEETDGASVPESGETGEIR